jgi:tripartite-type tricarboxylate transporter receptor subunit TctC
LKANPGKYSYASAGFGTPSHLTSELFRTSLGLDLIHAPFNGAGPAISSTLGGHTPIAFSSPASSVEQVRAGSLRGLAIAAKKRLSSMPDVPTMEEAGYPGLECEAWMAVLTPTGTPKSITGMLNRQIGELVFVDDVQKRMAALGFEPAAITPEQGRDIIRSESEKWTRVIQVAGIKPH